MPLLFAAIYRLGPWTWPSRTVVQDDCGTDLAVYSLLSTQPSYARHRSYYFRVTSEVIHDTWHMCNKLMLVIELVVNLRHLETCRMTCRSLILLPIMLLQNLSGGVVICLEWDADLPSRCHCHSLSFAPVNPDWFYLPGFTFLVLAHPGSPRHNPEKRKLIVVVVVLR